MGFFKAKEPMVSKETFWPADIIIPPANPLAFGLGAKDAPQATAYPAVQSWEGPLIAVFEVPEPPSKGHVHIGYDGAQALPIAASGFPSDGVFELLQALLARPSRTTLKVISEKIEPHTPNPGINQARFLRMQGQPFAHRQLCASLKAVSASCGDLHRMTKSSA